VAAPVLQGARQPNFSWERPSLFIPARIVCHILHGDFINMAELTEDHLELELKRSLDGEAGKPPQTYKLLPVPDLLSWVTSCCHFAGIIVSVYPDKAVDL